MKLHASNAEVISNGFCTLWYSIMLNQVSISDIVLYSGVEDLYHMMKMCNKEELVQESFCGLIAGIATSQNHALLLLRLHDGEIISLLMDVLQCPSNEGQSQENALKALLQLSLASISSYEPTRFIRRLGAIDNDNHAGDSLWRAVETIIHSMRYKKNTTLQIHGTRLLLNVLESKPVFAMEWDDLLLGKVLQHIQRIEPYNRNSHALHGAILCLLSKMSSHGVNAQLGSQDFPIVVLGIMRAEPSSSVVALHGCKCLTNMCIQAPSTLLSQTMVAACNGIPAIITCMDSFSDHVYIQSEACDALAAICNNCPSNKEKVWQLGGIDGIIFAFECYSDKEKGMATQVRACQALRTICLNSPAILADIRNKGVLARFAQEDAKASISNELRCAIQELLAYETCEFLRGGLLTNAKRFYTEAGLMCSLQCKALASMRQYPKCANIQQIGCLIFAGSSAELDVPHKECIEIIVSSLKEHGINPANVSAASLALQKLFGLQPMPDSSDGLIFRSFDELANSIVLHQENAATLEHAFGALLALFTTHEVLALVLENGCIIGMIVKAMNRFPESSLLCEYGIGILGKFFSLSERIDHFLTDEFVTAVVRIIEETESTEQGDAAIAIIRALSGNGPEAVAVLLANEHLIDSLMGCRYKWPETSSIQYGVVEILSKIAPYSEEYTCDCLRADLRLITTSDTATMSVSYSRSEAVQAMQRFPENASVHENACKLLACCYALASQGGSVAQNDTTCEELRSLTNSLAVHKKNRANAAVACSAIQNLCIMLSLSDSGIEKGSDLSRSVAEAANVIDIYPEDKENLEQATGALQAICAMTDELSTPLRFDRTISMIIEAMNRFPDSIAMQRHGMGILATFFSVSENGMRFVTVDLVNAVVRFIESSDEEIESDSAVNILRCFSNRGFPAIEIMVGNEVLIDSIVGCMFRWPVSSSIQTAATCILSNIALGYSKRAEICHKGGTSRIVSALGTQLKEDPVFVCQAFVALATLMGGDDVEVLSSPDTPAPEIFVRAMKAHPQNLSIQINGASALWVLSARSECFKDGIVDQGGAEAIAMAMSRFVASQHMQAKGFVAIWSLAGPNKRHQDEIRKARVGQCAIEPVICGLSAHVNSDRLVKKALGCLKCLSTIAPNKKLLEEAEAVELIYSCIWRHCEDVDICGEALAALCNISVNTFTNEVTEIMDNDLQAIALAMRTHGSDKSVQQSAIILLRNFSLSHINVEVLGQNPFLTDLVRLAKSNFNDDVGDRADDYLHFIGRS